MCINVDPLQIWMRNIPVCKIHSVHRIHRRTRTRSIHIRQKSACSQNILKLAPPSDEILESSFIEMKELRFNIKIKRSEGKSIH
ncbi:hypothetical protein RHMOL_Rhmol12G0149200 [Rhododendron molle]|uniref:Uncharacterized protein n=1 Tax=Rhododendron molle TaxID=49168 RepID=A0ACC0LIK8_RHOML|nr:hypothetical protein RHMOL_Rhmol12G0149200 [Rhododendron molle]